MKDKIIEDDELGYSIQAYNNGIRDVIEIRVDDQMVRMSLQEAEDIVKYLNEILEQETD